MLSALRQAVSDSPSGAPESDARSRLLVAASDAFASYGFDGASLRQIAQQAGVAFQLISYHFGSKETLWLAAVDHLLGVRVKAAKSTFSPVRDFEQQLREWLRIALRFSMREPQLRKIMCQELLARSQRYEQHLKPRMREATPFFNYFFEQPRRQGIVTRLSSPEMQLVLRGLLILTAVDPDYVTEQLGITSGEQEAVERLIDLVVKMFIDAR